MKTRFRRLLNSSTPKDIRTDPLLANSCAGRLLSALTLIAIILCLALWITAFLLLKDHLFAASFSGNILTNLTCVVFFGGLAIAIFIGALAGNFLRRAFWNRLIVRRKS